MLRRILAAALFIFFAATTIYASPVSAAALSAYIITDYEAEELLLAGEAVYARILSTDAFLYTDADCTDKLFQLPHTYYVKLLECDSACKVMYCYEDYDYARGIIGYVKREHLTFVDQPPTGKSFPNIFPEFEGNGTFYKNNRFDSFYSASDTAAGSDCFFYGFYTRGAQRFCYVLHGGKLGYYSADLFKDFTLPTHSDPMPTVKEPPEQTDQSISSTGSSAGVLSTDAGKTIFIAVTCIIAICAVYLIFLPKKSPQSSSDDDEE